MKKIKIIIFFIILVILSLVIVVYLNLDKKQEIIEEIEDSSELDIDWDSFEKYDISLNESINISKEGVYNLTGKIDSGNITINTNGYVKLIFDGVDINSSDGPALYIENAKAVYLYLNDNTVNKLVDSSTYTNTDFDGVIYSKDDLWIGGSGNLEITSNYQDAIVIKDDLTIENGYYKIVSIDDGIRGKDKVVIKNGTFDIITEGDAIKSSNDTDESLGYILIENGEFNIESKLDGIVASTNIQINNGEFNLKTGSGSTNESTKIGWGMFENKTDTESMKGIKATNNIIINGGNFNIDSADDSIHSNNSIIINDGVFNISSGDDGIHSDSELIIKNGNINIQKSYEGLESSKITIENGKIYLLASDDGINVAGGNDSSSMGRPGANTYNENSDRILTINGGYIYVDSSGDGLDSNGNILITGGTIIVNGPTNDGNGALDYDSSCKITGGILIAFGSKGMVQNVSDSSTQNSVLINFDSTYSAGTLINISSSSNEIITFKPNKSFSSILISTSLFKQNDTYTINVGGNHSGEEKDGFYSNGTYSDGSKYDTFDFTDTIISVGNTMGMIPGGKPENQRGQTSMYR